MTYTMSTWCSTSELTDCKMVWVAGSAPASSCFQGRPSTRLTIHPGKIVAGGVGIEPTHLGSKPSICSNRFTPNRIGIAYGNRTRLFGLKGQGPTQKSNAMYMVPHDRIELPYSDYKTDVIPLYE